MKQLIILLCLAGTAPAMAASDSPGDISTPEARNALIARLWDHSGRPDVELWPTSVVAGASAPYAFLEQELAQSNLLLHQVTRPRFVFYRASNCATIRQPAVLVCPGGGYKILSWNQEGVEVAEYFNRLGFSAAVLLYRTEDPRGALADAQRAIGILRHKADEYGIDARRLGVVGFSAGANLATALATNWRERIYPALDAADGESCRPDFFMPIYPWDLRARKEPHNPWAGWLKTLALRNEFPVDHETPPAFIVQTLDDFCEIETAVALDTALRRAGVDTVLRVYQSGGHGYGLRRLGKPSDLWSSEAASFLARFQRPRPRVAFLGDSITDPCHVGCTKNFWGVLEDRLGIEPLVYGKSGNTVGNLLAQIARLEHDAAGDSVPAIVVFAGTNDFNGNVPLGEWFCYREATVSRNGRPTVLKKREHSREKSTLRGSFNLVLGQLRERFPRARIVLATPLHRGFAKFSPTNEQPDESYANELGLFIDDYAAVVREAGQIWAVEVVDLFANSGLHPLTPAAGEFFAHPLSDRLHPSDAGHRRIADALEDAVRRAIRPE